MFEEIISQLQTMNVDFEEMPDQGMLSVQVDQMDKMQLIEVLNMVNSMGMTVTELTESTMTVSAGAMQAPEPQPVQEENTQDDAAQMAALDEAISGM
jgi:hypothetical protein